ncbi:GerAB/ArcD/ProY family transporter [Paenibacillus glycinis]|uniref:Endospore germination permease n=1 Tax=Paenibacillus glycinis TaxID=2697035 RepID=A0ABW9XKG0_9BACL|nr:endospore germination permease [Paenibacillus glycinis]NBD23086.1 endospore germination permease [Paenibacillus glycinis]
METARLSSWQMFLLTLAFTLGTSFFIIPGGIIGNAKEYAWLIPLGAGLYGIVVAALWLYLTSRYPGLGIIQLCLKLLGPKIGFLFGCLYLVFFIQLAAWVVRNLGDFIKVNLLVHTPISAVHLMFLLVSAYTVILGAETIAMLTEFLTPVLVIVFWIVFFLMLKGWDWANFGPAQEFHPWQLMATSKQIFGFPFSETVCLTMFFPFVQQRLKTSFIAGIGVAAILISLIVFFVLGIVGVYRSSHLTYPIFTLAQELPFSFFIEHLEVIICLVWFCAISIKLSISMYSAAAGIIQLFHLKNRTFIALPLIWIILPISLLFESVISNIEWDRKYSFAFDSFYAIVIPALLVIVSWIRKKQLPDINQA